jgi:hypothetical protein
MNCCARVSVIAAILGASVVLLAAPTVTVTDATGPVPPALLQASE